MKRKLRQINKEAYYYKNKKKINGFHNEISGNVSEISGDVSEISGNVSRISGDVSGISGDASGISGDVDLCEITKEEREKGIKIEELIENKILKDGLNIQN